MDESISYLVERIKEEMFSPSADMLSFLPPSPYETAWVAMVAGPQSPHRPMFPQCLEWIIRHQREEGYWGELGNPMDSLTSTLACVVALNAWDTGHANIEKGKTGTPNHLHPPSISTYFFSGLVYKALHSNIYLNKLKLLSLHKLKLFYSIFI